VPSERHTTRRKVAAGIARHTRDDLEVTISLPYPGAPLRPPREQQPVGQPERISRRRAADGVWISTFLVFMA
jgi:hypothetical protein